MTPKSLLTKADRFMDPLGILVVVILYFSNKWWALNLTVDEVLLANLGFGAARTLWESRKRKSENK